MVALEHRGGFNHGGSREGGSWVTSELDLKEGEASARRRLGRPWWLSKHRSLKSNIIPRRLQVEVCMGAGGEEAVR